MSTLAIRKTILFILLQFSFQPVFCQADCDLKVSRDSIFIYTCKVSDSKLKSIKADFKLKTTPEILAAILTDVAQYPQWQYNNIDATLLKKISNNEIIYRSEVEAPWPVSHRELVMHLKITKDSVNNIMIVDVNSMPEYIPEKEDMVRVPSAHAHWEIVPLNKKEMHINYSLVIDPGGSIPAWLLNLAIAEGPFETFKSLKSRTGTIKKTL